MKFTRRYRVKTSKPVKLKDWDSETKYGVSDRAEAEDLMQANLKAIWDLQYRLYAEDKQSLLIVLQGMDAAGKDGTIRHVMSGVNPQGCRISSFKKPSENELQRDYLWRIHKAVPCRGEIGIFNRSHYEDVLVVRVHNIVPKAVWSQRYEQINRFERNLAECGTRIIKCYLHISKDEQKERLQRRIDDPRKNWKFNRQDLAERKKWKDYQKAFEEALSRCSKPWAPWFVIPCDRKWYRNFVVSSIVRETLEDMNPKIPKCEDDLSDVRIE